MLDTLLAYRFGVARVVRVLAGIGAAFYFKNSLGWPWYYWSPAAIAVLLVAPVFWGIFLGLLERRAPR
jgi:hypothetical protein